LRKAVQTKLEDITMAMEKKSLVSKTAASASKTTATKKFDNSKPTASKVVAARKIGNAH
jgi:hypothetical protein